MIIIPVYNGGSLLKKAVNSVPEGSVMSDILMIDNASEDSGVEDILSEFPSVKCIKNSKNSGFGRAVNQGFEYALKNTYKYALVMNQDVELLKDTIEKLTNTASLIPTEEWSFISPLNLSSGGTAMEKHFKDNYRKRAHAENYKLEMSEDLRSVDFINAACWLVNLSSLEVLKGFDKRFFMYGEDLEFCQRSKKKGYKMFVHKNACCIHHKNENDYSANPDKLTALKLGETMAWYLSPGISVKTKILHFLKVNLVCIRLLVQKKNIEAREKFQINLTAVLRLL